MASRHPAAPADSGSALTELRNIGPVSARWLAAVGVRDRIALEQLGALGAFQRVRKAGLCSSLNLLYALEGALIDLHWNQLPEPLRRRLKQAAQELEADEGSGLG